MHAALSMHEIHDLIHDKEAEVTKIFKESQELQKFWVEYGEKYVRDMDNELIKSEIKFFSHNTRDSTMIDKMFKSVSDNKILIQSEIERENAMTDSIKSPQKNPDLSIKNFGS